MVECDLGQTKNERSRPQVNVNKILVLPLFRVSSTEEQKQLKNEIILPGEKAKTRRISVLNYHLFR